MNVLIIDNNVDLTKKLKNDLYIYFTGHYERVNFDTYSSDFKLINFEKHYDYAFIDIDLHETYDGIDLAIRLKKYNLKLCVIFVSAYSELIHDSLIIQPFYFIRKTTYEEDLLKFFSLISKQVEINQLIELNYKGEKNRVNINDIICIETLVHQLIIRTKQKDYHDNRSLKEFYKLLSKDNFIQIHKSFIINLDYLLDYRSNHVILTKDMEINVGRSYKENFNKVLKEYILK